MGAASRRRSSVGLGTVGHLSTIKPAPPEMPRGSSLLDITNGAGTDSQVSRLSTQALELMSKVRIRDGELARQEDVISKLQKEISNLTVTGSKLPRTPEISPPSLVCRRLLKLLPICPPCESTGAARAGPARTQPAGICAIGLWLGSGAAGHAQCPWGKDNEGAGVAPKGRGSGDTSGPQGDE